MVPGSSSISQLDPKKCTVSNIIIQWSHHSVALGARRMTLNHLRQRGI